MHERICITGLYDPSGLQHVSSVCDRQCLFRILLYEQYRRTGFIQCSG